MGLRVGNSRLGRAFWAIVVFTSAAFAEKPKSFDSHLVGLSSLEITTPLIRQLQIEQPALAHQIFDPERSRALRVGEHVLLPPDGQTSIRVRTVAEYESYVTRKVRQFDEDVAIYRRASAETNTYWNRMTGTWRSERGHGGKTAPEIEADAARGRMLKAIFHLQLSLGVAPEQLAEHRAVLAAADENDRRLVDASYRDLTRKMYTIPILAFAAPVALYVAAPGAVIAGSGTFTGTGLTTVAVTTKSMGTLALTGAGLGLGTDGLSQSAAILDGKQKGWSLERSAYSAGGGAVFLPASVMAPPLGAVVFTESTLYGSLSAYHNYEDGHRWSVAADITNTVVIPLAIYKASVPTRGPPAKTVETKSPEPLVQPETVVVSPEPIVATNFAESVAVALPAETIAPPVASAAKTSVPDDFPLYVFQTNRPCSKSEAEAFAAAKFEFRNRDFESVTREVDGLKMLDAQNATLPMSGISATVTPTSSGLRGCYVRLPPGKELPQGMAWSRDGKDVIPTSSQPEGHVTIANIIGMKRSEAKKLWESWIKQITTSSETEKGFIPENGGDE